MVQSIIYFLVRDRPFNLKGGYGFLFRSEIFFRTTQEFDLRSEANQQTGTRELTTDLRSVANQKTDTRKLTTDLRSEANQKTDTRELTDLSSEANQ